MIEKVFGATLALSVIFGWFCILLIIICLWVWKGDFESSYNYRPWKPFAIPEDLADRVNRKYAKWLLALAVLTLGALAFGVIYGYSTGNYYIAPSIIVPLWIVLMLVLIVAAYVDSWLLLKKRNVK